MVILNEAKQLEMVLYNDYRYVSLIVQKPESGLFNRTNSKDDDWKGIFTMKGNNNAALIECDVCNNMKSTLVLPKFSNSPVESGSVEEVC